MGFADFPVEILRALRIKPSENTVQVEGPYHILSGPQFGRDAYQKVTHAAGSQIENQPKSAGSSRLSLESTQTGAKSPDNPTSPNSPSEPQPMHGGFASPTDEDPQNMSRQNRRLNHPNSMRSALKESLSRSSSRSSSPSRQPGQPPHRSLSNTQAGQISLDAALGAGKSIKQIVGAGLKSPMDFTLGLARGFHNAPKLYGDESVRQADKVTDLQSGLKAAGKVWLLEL